MDAGWMLLGRLVPWRIPHRPRGCPDPQGEPARRSPDTLGLNGKRKRSAGWRTSAGVSLPGGG
jgi:hypothetical protein